MRALRGVVNCSLLILLLALAAVAQMSDLKLTDWRPRSQVVTEQPVILKPKFPVVDIHKHLRDLDKTKQYLAEMDKAGVWKCVSLDGKSAGDFYKEHLRVSHAVSKDRLLVFFRPDFSRIDEPNSGENEARRLEVAVRQGVRGLKIAKSLGLTVCNKSGQVVPVDDPRIDPNPAHPYQGRWMVYGLFLPDQVLEKTYNKNALEILGMFKEND